MDERCIAEREHSLEDWVEVFRKDPPATLDIAGGEPLSVPWIVDFIRRIGEQAETSGTKVGLSTNGLFSGSVQRLSERKLANVISINMSFHPNIMPWLGDYLDRYKRNIGMLKNAGYHVFSSIVDYEDNVRVASECGMLEWLKRARIQVAVSPYEDMDDVAEKTEGRELDCDGGIAHKVFTPSGFVFPCLTTLRSPDRWEFVRGNVFDPRYDPHKERGTRGCRLFCYDYYVLQKKHPGGDMWGVNARPSTVSGLNIKVEL